MVKRLSDCDIWKKDWFLDLPDKQKLLVKFLYDNCDCAGVYEISQRMLKNCFFSEITKEDFKAIKQVKFISDNKIYIEDFIKFHYNVDIPYLNPSNNLHKGILKCLEKHNIITLDEPLTKGTIKIKINNNNNNNISNNNIPTKNEILDYAHNQLGKHINADYFIAYYDASDWKDKSGLSINWKQALINWIKNEKITPLKQEPKSHYRPA